MKVKSIIWLIGLLIIASQVIAIPQIYETSSVSRIVGNDAKDLERQLNNNKLDFVDANYMPSSSVTPSVNEKLVKDSFPGHYAGLTSFSSWLESSSNRFIVLDPAFVGTPTNAVSLGTSDIDKDELDDSPSLILINSEYTGLPLANQDSFAIEISPHTSMVAPTAYDSHAFTRSFICNAGYYANSLGETFRQSRNNYHWNTEDSSELIGLTLLSYSLYGNPFSRVTIPETETPIREAYCKDLTEEFEVTTSEFSIMEEESSYSTTIEFEIPSHTIDDENGSQLINTPETQNILIPGQLVLPSRTIATEFPHNTIITGIEVIETTDSEEITANIPIWNGGYQQRTCPQTNEIITFSHARTDHSDAVIANIKPIEIMDCDAGNFKLYKKITYKINYIPYSPIMITNVEVPENPLPDTVYDITVDIQSVTNSITEGTLLLRTTDQNISINNISTSKTEHTLELLTPTEEGTYIYYVDFIQGGQVKDTWQFSLTIQTLEGQLEIPLTAEDETTIKAHVYNHGTTSITTNVTAELTHESEQRDYQTKEITLTPGENTIEFTFTDLTKEDKSYDLEVNVPYFSNNLQLVGIITTNHPPTILNNNLLLNEADVVSLTPEAEDIDGDSVEISIIENPFPLDGTHTLSYESSGTYEVTISATDGIETVEKTISIVVENTNRPPTVAISDINGKEDTLVVVSAFATDPDNENSVDNDDNELTITYGYPLDEEGKWLPTYEESGEYYTTVTVSDGILSDTKVIKITIANTNRPPNLDALTDITIKEGESVELWKGNDPDNENSVDNDDNTLQFYFSGGPDGGPIDHYGKWKTDYQDSGVYPITVQVEDGELKTSKTITLTVLNVNRPPVITAPDAIYANGSVDLSVYITDPDNMNSVTNDDNVLSASYTSPFDSNGRWTPPQADSAAQTTITLSDGEFTVQKTVTVVVLEIDVPAEQSPPEPEIPEETPEIPTNTTEPAPTNETSPAPTNDTTPTPPANTSSLPPVNTTTPTDDLFVEVKVDGDKVDDGDSVKLKPNEEFKVKIELKNNANTTKDIDVEVDLSDLDQDDDDLITLEKGESENLDFEFSIPKLTEEDEYELEITVNDGKTRNWDVVLKIDKPSHELTIRDATLTPEILKCEETEARLDIRVDNTGKDDEDAVLSIESSTLKIQENMPFEISQGDTRLFSKIVNTMITGQHDIFVKAQYGSKQAETSKKLTIEACKKEIVEQTATAPVQATPVIPSANQKTAITVENEKIDLPGMLGITFLILGSLFTLLTIAAILMRK